MTTDYLGPRDRWPRHQRPEAQIALSEARRDGWYLKPGAGSAHLFGRLRCRSPQELPTGACVVGVYSTSGARDGSDSAQVIRDALRTCPHHHEATETHEELAPEDAATEAAVLANRLRNLLTAASALLAEAEHHDEIDRLIADTMAPLAEPTEADEERLQALEAAAASARGKGLAMGIAARVEPWPPAEGLVEVLAIAEGVNVQLLAMISEAQGANAYSSLQGEAVWLGERLLALLRQIN